MLQQLPKSRNMGLSFDFLSFHVKAILSILNAPVNSLQARISVKIIGGDETEPSKVAHIATEFLGNLGNTFVISAQKHMVSKKKKRSSSKLSHNLRPKSEILTFFLPKIRCSPKKKKKRSSSKFSHNLRPKSEILTFFLPKIRCSPKKKKKKKKKGLHRY